MNSRRSAKSNIPQLIRSYRHFLFPTVNAGKIKRIADFLLAARDAEQCAIDRRWEAQNKESTTALDYKILRNKWGFSAYLAACIDKQASEVVKATITNKGRRPKLRNQSLSMYKMDVAILPYIGNGGFDYMVCFKHDALTGLVVPIKATPPLKAKLANGWELRPTIRLIRDSRHRYAIDLYVNKEAPALKTEGEIVGMDSNLKNGYVFSNGDCVFGTLGEWTKANDEHKKSKRKKRADRKLDGQRKTTKHELERRVARRKKRDYTVNFVNQHLKKIDLSSVKTLAIEDLKHIKRGKHGKFPRKLNRRLSQWQYTATAQRLAGLCEEAGVGLVPIAPAYTSMTCNRCGYWDKRNRKGDQFNCHTCGYQAHADRNASNNIRALAVAGKYSILPKNKTSGANPSASQESLGIAQSTHQKKKKTTTRSGKPTRGRTIFCPSQRVAGGDGG